MVAIFVALATYLAVSAAQESYMTVWNDSDYDGHRTKVMNLTESVPELSDLGLDDEISAVQVFGDSDWELYTNEYYSGGRMLVTPGARLRAANNNAYSSARKICKYDDNPESAKIVIYQDSDSQGDSIEFYGAVPDLGQVRMESNPRNNWNDRLSSFWGVKGDWEMYNNANFEGQRWVVREGEADNMGWGFLWSDHDRITSLRPICDTYKPVTKCTPYQVELVEGDDLQPVLEGIEVIGSQSGGTCSGAGSHTMTLSNTDSVTETTSLQTSTAEEYNWENSQTLGIALIGAPWGVGGAIGMSWTSTEGGAVTMTSSETKSFAKGNEKTAAQSVTYKAPGGGLIFGVVERYIYDRSNTPTKIYSKCTDGSEKVEDGTMTLRSVTFPSVNYWSWSGRFSKKACQKNRNLPDCISNVRRKYTQSGNIDSINRADVDADWKACFKGVGGKDKGGKKDKKGKKGKKGKN